MIISIVAQSVLYGHTDDDTVPKFSTAVVVPENSKLGREGIFIVEANAPMYIYERAS
jgi:hypothetical protein